MDSTQINAVIGITESYELPDVLMKIMEHEEKSIELMQKFQELGESLDHDWFTGYFEEQHANKSKMAQDFTPREVADLAAFMLGDAKWCADVCTGTGGLSIAVWNRRKDTRFVCYEYSGRAIPILLLNMALRNINAYVVKVDILTGETFEYWHVIPGETYGKVVAVDSVPIMADAVISNPPFSMKYDPKKDKRFPEYKDMLPSNFADYVFVAFALSILKPDGKMCFILPHGVLFRGNKEGKFRKMLIEKGYIRTVIGLPDKLFINTDIPTMILEIDTGRSTDGILFIDAKKECEKRAAKNIIDAKSFEKICQGYEERQNKEHFATLISLGEIRENDYNLNISRYVDTYVPEELPDLEEILQDLAELENQSFEEQMKLLDMMKELNGTNQREDRKYKKALKVYRNTLTRNMEEYRQEVLKL